MRAERLPHEAGDGDGAERFEVEGASAGTAGQAPERLGVVGEFVGPIGDHDQQRELLGAGRERGEPAQGFGIGPVRVVEDEDHRGAQYGEMGEHPVEAVAQPLLVGRGTAGGRAQAEGGADDVVPTAQRGTEIGLRGTGQLRLQQLSGDVEGDALLLVAAARGQHGAAPARAARRRTSARRVVLPMPARPAKARRAPRGRSEGSAPSLRKPVSSPNASSTAASSLSRSKMVLLLRTMRCPMVYPLPRWCARAWSGRAP